MPGYNRPSGLPPSRCIRWSAGRICRRSIAFRLYFEVRELDALCKSLQAAGVEMTQLPKPMPWGWTHAYLNDPDGHEVSLYWAGAKRLRGSGTAKKQRAAVK